MLPVALLPDLLELEANLPADPTTFFAAAFDPSAPPAPGARAAAEVLRHAASQGLETADLMQQLRMLGLGEAGAIFFANYWAAQPSRASLQREPPLQLLDVDWSFGVSASSSEHQAMGTTFVQLRLSTQGQNGGEFVHTGAAVARWVRSTGPYVPSTCAQTRGRRRVRRVRRWQRRQRRPPQRCQRRPPQRCQRRPPQRYQRRTPCS